MSLFRSSAAALLVTTALTPAAWADLSAQDAWQNMQDYYTAANSNSELSFDSAEQSGNTLTVKGLVFSSANENEIGDTKIVSTAKLKMGDLRFVENGDGTVSVEIAEQMHADIAVDSSDDDDDYDLHMLMSNSDTQIIVSEDGGAYIYDVTSGSVSLSFPEGFGEDMIAAGPNTATLSNVSSNTRVEQGEVWKVETAMAAEKAELDFGAKERASQDGFTYAANYEGFKLEAVASFPEGFDSSDPAAVFGSGDMQVVLEVDAGPSQTQMTFSVDGDESNYLQTDESSRFEMASGDGGFSLNMANTGVDLQVSGAELPFPILAKARELGFGLLMPVAKSDAADARLSITLDQIELGDAIWNIADPAEVLPRGPLTVRAGLSGVLKLMANLFDPDDMQDAAMKAGGAPMLPVSARIDELLIEGVGIKAQGEGAVDFDHEDMMSFGGMPAPIGDVTITASGVNGLIDNLIKMGILPEDQAMMSRMMIGMFSESTGDDALRSHIEFKTGGHVFANGQQLR